ncbi:MAG: DUF1343 domain-containing protein [Clostridiales bacterium]|nr:DUF1343 domain-containing protein [Clostridiales bacterium]
MPKIRILTGLDQLERYDHLLHGRRIGLMTNQTGIDLRFRSVIDLLQTRYDLRALFACEHGIRGAAPEGAPVDTFQDPLTGLTVYSTFANGGRLSPEMTEQFDLLIFDMQDVGARFYTYLYSLSYAMEECARRGKSVLVLDRPNPIGGLCTEGTVLDEACVRSFVGEYALPTRYGLTIGEYALWVRRHLNLDLDLTIAPLKGWYREYLLPDLELPFVAPSPNMPSFDSMLCYIGTCLFEGTNVSEGRGTTLPFQYVGAPWLNHQAVCAQLNRRNLPGVYFRPCVFIPGFSKYAGQACQGIQLHVTDPAAASFFAAGLYMVEAIARLHGDHFAYLPDAQGQPAHFQHLLGTTAFTDGLADAEGLLEASRAQLRAFDEERRAYFLYR